MKPKTLAIFLAICYLFTLPSQARLVARPRPLNPVDKRLNPVDKHLNPAPKRLNPSTKRLNPNPRTF